ncbi:two-component sensor histidine kinase [Micractinium conductrix]|uniref:Two-component sensor histidine kinase n=1 Tax=Micractinium conductrix TaxID=554055 RepID=A0A2P6V461_9CHLO|nr:two-component sensor histidine kinase [Micractinium conductrix]|eukprot:PSC68874.1 two-component sensor histidine kinase [Micractinium conductrix]
MLGLLARRSLKAGGLIVELEEIGIRRSLTSSASSSGRHRLRPAAAASRRPPEPGTLPPAVQQQDDQVAAQQEQWEEVQHPSGYPYYWNRQTNETTALGEPRPGPEGRLATYQRATVQPRQAGPRAGLGQLVAMGAGVGLVFALLSRIL